MIVVRNIFRLKFGQAKQATDAWKRAIPLLGEHTPLAKPRLLTDLAGAPYYTLVVETTHESLAAFEQMHKSARDSDEWKSIYKDIAASTEEGRREIFTIVQ